MYRTVINGITFGADTQLLDKVKDQVPFQLIQSEEEFKVIIVFCTISSRVGSDVEAVMSDIKGKRSFLEPVHIGVEIAHPCFYFVCLQDFALFSKSVLSTSYCISKTLSYGIWNIKMCATFDNLLQSESHQQGHRIVLNTES